MATRLLDARKLRDLQPATALFRHYRPDRAPLRFRPTSGEAWQRKVSRELSEAIGLQRAPKVPMSPRQIERVDCGDYVREKIVLRTARHVTMPVYLLLPKSGRRPLATVIALHGHGYGVKDVVGLWEDGSERREPDGYHKDFAVALCRAGFAVAAPEIACFGERQTDFGHLDQTLGQPVPYTCTHTAMLAFHEGASVVGMRVRDGRRLIDYLETRSDVDTRRLGAMGISGGGMHTFFLACVDRRIRACVVSGYFCEFRQSIFAMHHCACNFVPGLSRFGEIHDLAGLVAPRPMLVEAGHRDPLFPIAAVKKTVAKARRVYRAFGAEERLATDYFHGRHQISGRKAYAWLTSVL
jgi:dienelactone hydrolase